MVQFLDWDSSFFQWKVGKITTPELSEDDFVNVVQHARDEGYTLVYWPANETMPDRMGHIIEAHGGFLADMKTTFVLQDIQEINPELESAVQVTSYDDTMPFDDLVKLAIQSGESSRYAIDPQIPRARFEELYTIWIKKSVTGELAKDVLVIYDGRSIGGMITVGEKNGRGDIGLVAVDEKHRGKQYGKALVNSAIDWSIKQGYSTTQVVTQGTNAAACSLYEKCGYHIETVEAYYHIWV